MSKVIFKKDGHKYLFNGINYKSNSSVIKSVENRPFMEDRMSKICSLKEFLNDRYNSSKKSLGYKPDKIIDSIEATMNGEERVAYENGIDFFLKKWRDKSELGTRFHDKMEKQDIDCGKCVNKFDGKSYKTYSNNTEHDNEAICEDMYDVEDGYYPEFIVFNHKYKIAGQIDKLFVTTIGDKRYVDLDDWKTDDEINMDPDFFEEGYGIAKYKFPFDHLRECNYNQYCLKISLYAWMLQEAGFTVRSTMFTHVNIDPDTLEIVKSKDYVFKNRIQEIDYYMNNLYKVD